MPETLPQISKPVNTILCDIHALVDAAESSAHPNIAIKTRHARWMIDSLAALDDANDEIDRLESVIIELRENNGILQPIYSAREAR